LGGEHLVNDSDLGEKSQNEGGGADKLQGRQVSGESRGKKKKAQLQKAPNFGKDETREEKPLRAGR